MDHIGKRHRRISGRAPDPAGPYHPVIEGDADHPVPGNDGADLLIVELALVRDERPGVTVAGEHRAAVTIQRLPEGFVGEMGEIEQDPKLLHRAEQLQTLRRETKLRGSAACVTAPT